MTYLRLNSCLAVDRSLSPILLGLHAAAQMGDCQVWTWGKGAGVARGEVAIPVPARRICLGPAAPSWPPLLVGHMLAGCSPFPSHTLRVQAASVRSVLGTQPASECRPCGPLGPDAGHRLQGVPGDLSLPLGIMGGGSGPSPPHPTPNSF